VGAVLVGEVDEPRIALRRGSVAYLIAIRKIFRSVMSEIRVFVIVVFTYPVVLAGPLTPKRSMLDFELKLTRKLWSWIQQKRRSYLHMMLPPN